MKLTMKHLLFGLGSFGAAIAPIAAVVACSNGGNNTSTSTQEINDLTSAQGSFWHTFFHVGGRSLPKDGTIFGVTVNGHKIQYTWTSDDSRAKVPSTYLAGIASQPQVLSYLAARFATVKTITIKEADVYAAFGVPHHGAGTYNPADTTGHPSTIASEQANVATQAQIDAVVAEIAKVKDKGVAAIKAAATLHDLDAIVPVIKAEIDNAIVSPVFLSDVRSHVEAAKATIDTEEAARRANVASGKTYIIGATGVGPGRGFHAMFQSSLKIMPGDVIQMAFDTETLSYTWLQSDADHAATASWKYVFPGGSQQEIINYVTSKLANASHSVDAVKAKLGFSSVGSPNHSIVA